MPPRRRYPIRYAQWGTSIACTLLLLVALSMCLAGSRGVQVQGIVISCGCLALIGHSFIAPSIELTESTLIVRTTFRTVRLPRPTVQGAHLTTGRPMFAIALQTTAALRMTTGEEKVLTYIQTPQRRGLPNPAIAAVVDAISEWASSDL